jgi:quercetin dioxygenase-like cupin family protein
MKTAADATRSYAFVFPGRPDIPWQMIDETLHSGRRPEFETLAHDIGGYVLAGTLRLEIRGQPLRAVRAGDGFYVARGLSHRGYAVGKEPVRLISVCVPGHP